MDDNTATMVEMKAACCKGSISILFAEELLLVFDEDGFAAVNNCVCGKK